MSYTKYLITAPQEAEEILTWLLSEAGIDALEIVGEVRPEETADREEYEELAPVHVDYDGKTQIVLYAAEGEEAAIAAAAKEAIAQLPVYGDYDAEMTEETVEDENWAVKWKEFFHPFAVEDLLFVPTWEPLPEDAAAYRQVIRMDPGLAFGTGKHESTQLCIRRLLSELQPGDRVLDVGFGSGVLSVVSLLLGASQAAGTDVDPLCLEALAENMAANGLSYDPARFEIGDLRTDAGLRARMGEGCYDVVCANILADIIIDMLPALAGALRPGGLLITSGIIDFKEEAVVSAMEQAGLSIVARDALGEWRGVTARKD